MDAGHKEFELKLELGEDDIARIAGSDLLAEMTHGDVQHKHLVSTYFDTPEHALEKAGASLRIRETGSGRLQTAKLGTAVVGGVSNPLENETPTTRKRPYPGVITDEKLRRKLLSLVDFSALKPIFRTDISRTAHHLVLPGVEAELSFDTGQLSAGRRSAPISEIELEQISGGVEAFCDLAMRLFGDIPIRFSTRSKAGLGYALVAGGLGTSQKAVKSALPRLKRGDDVATAFAAVCQSAVTQILENWAQLGDNTDPEVAHQLRVGLRRLRSALRAFRGEIDGRSLREIQQDLGEVGRIVGRLRNIDVLLIDIVRPPLAGHAEEAGVSELAKWLIEQCAREREAVAAELARPRWNRLALRIALLPHGAGWAGGSSNGLTASELAGKSLDRIWKKVRRQGRDIDQLDANGRHQLRKDLKTLRYALESFSSVLPKGRYDRFLRQLKTLQDSFGYLNDVVLAGTLPGMLPEAMQQDPTVQRHVGFVLGWHEGLSVAEWQAARTRWTELEKRRLPWRA